RIVEEVEALRAHVRTSFVIDSLTYLYEGGRCSALAAFGANLLSIKPSIEVDPSSGRMKIGTKYRGALPRVLKRYVADQLGQRTDLKPDRVFITHSGTSADHIELVRQLVEEQGIFNEIIITRAG